MGQTTPNPLVIGYVPSAQIASVGKGAVQALTWKATTYVDCKLGGAFSITLAGATTLIFVDPQPGQEVVMWLKQDGTGSRTPTFENEDATAVLYAGGSAPSWTATAGATDTAIFRYNDLLSKWVGASVALNIS